MISFEEWEAERVQDPEFVDAAKEHEPAYQIAHLRIPRSRAKDLDSLGANNGATQRRVAQVNLQNPLVLQPHLSVRRAPDFVIGPSATSVTPC
jgi:hypothetical protein